MNSMIIKGVNCYLDNEGKAWFNAADVAKGWGFVQVQVKNGKTYESIRWVTINKYLTEFGFPQQVGENDFIPENMVYRLGFKASNEVAQKFQALLADEILPTLRKTGAYVSPSARVDNSAQIDILLRQNAKMIETMAGIVKSVADTNERIVSILAGTIHPVNSNDEKFLELSRRQEASEAAIANMQEKMPPEGAKTFYEIAESLGLYTQYTGRPNVHLVADILKHELHIDTRAAWGRDDKYAVTCVNSVNGRIVPQLWIKHEGLVKLQEAIDAGNLDHMVKSRCYQRKSGDHKPGDWMYDYIQYGFGKKHVIANEVGERCVWAA